MKKERIEISAVVGGSFLLEGGDLVNVFYVSVGVNF